MVVDLESFIVILKSINPYKVERVLDFMIDKEGKEFYYTGSSFWSGLIEIAKEGAKSYNSCANIIPEGYVRDIKVFRTLYESSCNRLISFISNSAAVDENILNKLCPRDVLDRKGITLEDFLKNRDKPLKEIFKKFQR